MLLLFIEIGEYGARHKEWTVYPLVASNIQLGTSKQSQTDIACGDVGKQNLILIIKI